MSALEHEGNQGDHPAECRPCKRVRSRRSVLLHRALHNPQGITPYEFTRGFTKEDALMFWTDARALGLVGVGRSKRGGRLFALPSYEAPRERR